MQVQMQQMTHEQVCFESGLQAWGKLTLGKKKARSKGILTFEDARVKH